MEKGRTNRGFTVINFTDLYDVKCSLQKSSLATEDAVWLGVDYVDPKILASKTPQGGTGWVPYEIPEDVLLTTRMHLNREQAKELVSALNVFIETGDL
ncbi:hypothetical protein [Paenibacillus sp. NAIST15-1]|uniref:hypothetical protein n=1 Tax=Paenibacillus sp. NAIST15-1 TaxID=1605994 RepID=UPI0009332FB8|nr:hypothetical protein [Paenibacillus sp. NAIST15-1]